MALSKREIEIQIGRLARKTPMAATTYGRDMTRARVGWILSEHGKRAAFPSMEENCSLLLGMALGPPAEAVANQRYGALRLETSQTVAGDLLVSTQSFGGALEGELVLAGVPCADTVLKTMAAYAMAFTGPAREALSAVTCTVRFVKDDWFPYAAIEIIDGSRRHELLYWPANISLLMETGVPPPRTDHRGERHPLAGRLPRPGRRLVGHQSANGQKQRRRNPGRGTGAAS